MLTQSEKLELLSLAQEKERRLCESSLPEFIKRSWEVLEPTTPLKWNWHHELMCEYLTATTTGQIKRLIINVPPRSAKSTIGTICFPSWIWTREPDTRFLCGSYAESLARKHSIMRRDLIVSQWYQNHWGNTFQLRDDQNTKSDYMNSKSGIMRSASMLGSVTGEGGSYILIDDPQNPKQAFSDADREASLNAFDQAWSTRLNDKKTGRIIVIMQRLHQNDLTGHLLAKNAGYEHLCLPAEAEEHERRVFPVSGRVVEREAGELLHQSREGAYEIAQLKTDLGSHSFAGQYQQRPSALEGSIIKRSWLKFYKQLPKMTEKIQSWDLTFKDGQQSDFVVGQVWGSVGSDKYLIDQTRARMDFPTTIQAIRQLTYKHPDTYTKVIEDKANGSAAIATLTRELSGIVPFNPKTSKEARLQAVSPDFEAGNIYLPDPSIAPWVKDFIEELCSFPNAGHDDQVDAMTMALLRFRESSGDRLRRLITL